MSAGVVIAVGLLGGLGAVARVVVAAAVERRSARAFPLGTLAVNLAGALCLGLLVGAGVGGDTLRLAAIGLLGAFTTFSTWMVEAHRLAGAGRRRVAGGYLTLSLVLGLVAVWAGRALGGA